ncbi:MAG TPA: glycosyltransferase family A protein [Rhizomicrobium sp.]|jgi:hypothetical protein|nr:glycosyltransferase family A protein [Rhizomicrobium sp.]
MKKLPIVIMSFDRPKYLEAVLQSLIRQKKPEGYELVYYLFQDGETVEGTDTQVAAHADIQASIDRFRDYFPDGIVVPSKVNLGVALNFDRAERLLFLEERYDGAFFFEDDMLLQPHYLLVMAKLFEIALSREDFGVFTAYGEHPSMPLEEQRRRATELVPMNEHNWAFGLTRQAWLRRDKIVSEYLRIIDGVPYRERGEKHPEINRWLRSFGRGGAGYLSSQDSIKNMACEVLGIARLTTVTNNARYIGRKGLHMGEDRFYERGYHRTILFDDIPDHFDVPTIGELRQNRIIELL